MKNRQVGLIDYGAGNMRSVYKALTYLGANVEIIQGPEKLKEFHSVVLPGVGAFGDCSTSLRNQELFESVVDYTKLGRPFLGICVGYQILFEKSDEFNSSEPGLSLFRGTVDRFPQKAGLKVPQIGWNQISFTENKSPLFKGIDDGAYFYFVHSFHPVPQDPSIVSATTRYGHSFASAIQKDNVMATQFHPEKSQKMGLHLLQNFLNLE